jgi:uncharacterized protein (DUF433 family)
MATRTEYPHVVLDKDGAAHIQGTTMKVHELVLEREAYGWSPEELQFQHPYLTLAQIHAALAYYHDHAESLRQEIKRRMLDVEATRTAVEDQASPLRERLRAKGLL